MFLFNLFISPDEILWDGAVVYCSRDMLNLFAPVLSGTVVYCSRDMLNLLAPVLSGTVVYCSQDLTQL